MVSALLPLFALLLSVALLFLGNGLLGTLLPVRAQYESFTDVMIGSMGSLYFLGFGLGCVLGPFLIRRAGHIRTFAALAAVVASIPLLHTLFPTPWIWMTLRVIAGLCLAGLYTAIESWLNQGSSNETRGRVLSIYVMVNLAAVTAGQFLLNLDSPLNYRLFALITIVMALSVVPVALTRTVAPTPPSSVNLRLLRLYRLSPVGIVGAFLIGAANGIFWSVAPAYVSALGRDTATVANFMALAVISGAVAQWPLGRLSDIIDRRWVMVIACLGTTFGSIGLWLFGQFPLWLMIFGSVFGAMALSLYALCIAHTNDHVESADSVETSSSLLLTFAAGAVIGPFTGSYVMSLIGPGGLFLTAGTFTLILAAFAFYRMRMKAPVPADERENFVYVEPQTSAVVYELDPRSEYSGDDEAGADEDSTSEGRDLDDPDLDGAADPDVAEETLADSAEKSTSDRPVETTEETDPSHDSGSERPESSKPEAESDQPEDDRNRKT
ncbi:MFS transporter [Fodinicurvata fenggangensis]|uniref:MFS transporter n=1 Tax=Fodinicurvata fenggangensis TaxID=1121830 RepID=UPI0012DE7C4F|nr:MFS transporter [Fodinicurvata fenggangensis]